MTEYPQPDVHEYLAKKIIALLVVLIPAGLYTKFYSGPGAAFMHHYGGDIFYAIFWVMLAVLLFPSLPPYTSAGGVFLFCALIEMSQLVHHPALAAIRSTFIGRTLIGEHFSFADLGFYALGCLISVAIVHVIKNPPVLSQTTKDVEKKSSD